MKNLNEPSISIKVVGNNGEVKQVRSRKTKRIFYFLKAGNFPKGVFNTCVQYGGGFENSGTYNTKKELVRVLKIFLEK